MIPSMTTGWVVTDGKPGMVNQCLGLAEALGIDPVVKEVRLRSPWKQLSPHILRFGNSHANTLESAPLGPPWPDLLIATGRHSVASSLAVGKANPATFRVQIQDPGIDPRNFDLVVVPRHDRLRGANVLATDGALHRITPQRLQVEADKWRDRLTPVPHPRVAVMIGGSNAVYRLTKAVMHRLATGLVQWARTYGAGLMVTASRRTGADNEAILRETLAPVGGFVWDGRGENPYFGFLGLADVIVVTGDSVSMVSEACSTGKPVYVVDLAGGSTKFAAFHANLRAAGITRPFGGVLETWTYPPLGDTARVADDVRRRMTRSR